MEYIILKSNYSHKEKMIKLKSIELQEQKLVDFRDSLL